MSRSLARALNQATEAAKARVDAKRLHLKYLEVYAEQAEVPSVDHAVLFLDLLRRARGALATEGVSLNQWERDCHHHAGFAKFRSQFLEGNAMEKSSSMDLTRMYQNLRRMNLHGDAGQLWPRVAKALEGPVTSDDLIRVWATCPGEKLPELDLAMSKAAQRFRNPWQVLSVLSRTGAIPEQSKTLGVCAHLAAKMVQENFDISPADMATILYRLHVASERDCKEKNLGSAMQTIKQELVLRNVTLEVGTICKLLPCLNSDDKELWHLIRGQLSDWERLRNASLEELLEILQFFQRFKGAARQGRGHDDELRVRNQVKEALEQRLSRGHALPKNLTIVTRQLELVAPFGKLCEALLNVAIKLRQDLYPAVLWRFFVRTGEARLAERHRFLMPKFQRISEILEGHGIQRDKMSMMEMLKSARAMRGNQVKMPKCLEQMTTIFLQTLQHAQRHAGGSAVVELGDVAMAEVAQDAAGAAEDVAGAAEDVAGAAEDVTGAAEDAAGASAVDAEDTQDGNPEDEQVASKVEDSNAQVASMSGARKSLLSEVEHLVLLLWVELAHLEMPNLELSKASLGLCESNTLEMRRLVECIVEMAHVKSLDSEVQIGRQQLQEQLRKGLAQASDSELWEYLMPLSVDMDAAAMVFGEVSQRLMEEKLHLQSTSDLECLVEFLHQLQREDERRHELIEKVAKLLLEKAMENTSEEFGPKTAEILVEACVALAELPMEDDAQRDVLRPLLRRMLHRLHGEIDSLSLPTEDLVHFLFSLAALYGGRLPFDLMAYAWALAAKADMARTAGTAGKAETPHQSSDRKQMSVEKRAELWAFSLCARHLSTKTVWASLRLVPNAETLDDSIFTRQAPKFPLQSEKAQEELKQSLRLALSIAIPGELGEADYQVPGTPYVFDFALERLQLGLLIPRRCHASGAHLKGQGQMMEALLQAMGWRVLWVWPHAWPSVKVEELTEAVSRAIETPGVDVLPNSAELADVQVLTPAEAEVSSVDAAAP